MSCCNGFDPAPMQVVLSETLPSLPKWPPDSNATGIAGDLPSIALPISLGNSRCFHRHRNRLLNLFLFLRQKMATFSLSLFPPYRYHAFPEPYIRHIRIR